MIVFCHDRRARPDVGYPNLTKFQAEPFTPEWRQFEQHWPRTVPFRLPLYLKWCEQPYGIVEPHEEFDLAWYPIGIGWFDLTLDYIELLTPVVRQLLDTQRIRLLFYYHEGDNPQRIKHHLDSLCAKHGLSTDCYHFIIANSAAERINNFTYWPDHEFFFNFLNRHQTTVPFALQRQHKFTLLSRTHKAWRASAVSDLFRHGLLKDSLWSYGLVNDTTDEGEDPIQSLSDPAWAQARHTFMQNAPYACDDFDADQQNDHHAVNTELYVQSYCHIVLETHFDADQSHGTFLTEKTYKCLKYGQPFIIAGPQGSLQALRNAGYRTFDNLIDNSYDDISDNTLRWMAVRSAVAELNVRANPSWLRSCLSDIKHNQDLFASRTAQAVNTLLEKLKL